MFPTFGALWVDQETGSINLRVLINATQSIIFTIKIKMKVVLSIFLRNELMNIYEDVEINYFISTLEQKINRKCLSFLCIPKSTF